MADGMTSMAYSKADLKAMKDNNCHPCGDMPKYPWGLAIRLEQAELDKLGLAGLPTVGQRLQILATVEVTGVNSNQVTGEKPRTSVALQITDLQMLGDVVTEQPAPAPSKPAAKGGTVMTNPTRSAK